MSDQQSSYRQIMKATSVFGGVQVFNILIQLIRSKVIAVLLGPAGMGIMGLLTTAVSLISSFTNFGLGTSAVRDISESQASGNDGDVKATLTVLRTLVWATGILGMLAMLALAPWLSRLTFGNSDYTVAFMLLSVTVLLTQLSAEQTAVLQGLRKIQWMAKAGVYSAALGLIGALPLYYFFGMKGIVPGLILTSIIVFAVQLYFTRKVQFNIKALPLRQAFLQGMPMLKLGLMLSLSGLVTVAASYLVRIFISKFGDVSEVGLYNAGFSIVGVYVGMVFTAMSTDYFPRLSGVNSDTEKYNELINQQSETALLLLSPLICAFLIFINWAIIILYSDQFLPITEMVHFSVLGIYFKALSWAMAFLILAKADTKAFFWNELLANIYLLLFNCAGYYWDGLRGMGISFLLGYFIYFLQIYIFIRRKYGFAYNTALAKIMFLQLPIGVMCFLIYYFTSGWLMYLAGGFLVLCSTGISLYRINKSMDIMGLINTKFKKN